MSQVWALETDSCTQKLVLLAIADNANDNGVCWPSISRLAKKCQMSEQGIRNQLKILIGKQWLESKPRFDDVGDRSSNLYTIRIPGTKLHVGGGQLDLPPVVNDMHHGGQWRLGGVVNGVHPEPSVEPSVNPKGEKNPPVRRKFPKEAQEALKGILSDIQRLKDFGQRGANGKLIGSDAEEMTHLRLLEKENKRIAYEV